jgi:hypothetical protein
MYDVFKSFTEITEERYICNYTHLEGYSFYQLRNMCKYPLCREKLKRVHNGTEDSTAASRRTVLFISSGHVAFLFMLTEGRSYSRRPIRVPPLSCPEGNLKTLRDHLFKLHTVEEGIKGECSVIEP